jgi:hypothetical protein
VPYILKALQGGPPRSAALRGFRDCTEAVWAARKLVANFEESELPYAVQIEDASGEVIWECSIAEQSRSGHAEAPVLWYAC